MWRSSRWAPKQQVAAFAALGPRVCSGQRAARSIVTPPSAPSTARPEVVERLADELNRHLERFLLETLSSAVRRTMPSRPAIMPGTSWRPAFPSGSACSSARSRPRLVSDTQSQRAS